MNFHLFCLHLIEVGGFANTNIQNGDSKVRISISKLWINLSVIVSGYVRVVYVGFLVTWGET